MSRGPKPPAHRSGDHDSHLPSLVTLDSRSRLLTLDLDDWMVSPLLSSRTPDLLISPRSTGLHLPSKSRNVREKSILHSDQQLAHGAVTLSYPSDAPQRHLKTDSIFNTFRSQRSATTPYRLPTPRLPSPLAIPLPRHFLSPSPGPNHLLSPVSANSSNAVEHLQSPYGRPSSYLQPPLSATPSSISPFSDPEPQHTVARDLTSIPIPDEEQIRAAMARDSAWSALSAMGSIADSVAPSDETVKKPNPGETQRVPDRARKSFLSFSYPSVPNHQKNDSAATITLKSSAPLIPLLRGSAPASTQPDQQEGPPSLSSMPMHHSLPPSSRTWPYPRHAMAFSIDRTHYPFGDLVMTDATSAADTATDNTLPISSTFVAQHAYLSASTNSKDNRLAPPVNPYTALERAKSSSIALDRLPGANDDDDARATEEIRSPDLSLTSTLSDSTHSLVYSVDSRHVSGEFGRAM